MKFCSQCSHPIHQKVPLGDDRLRHVCTRCGIVHYQNPKIIAGCIPVWDDKILLCRRAIEPRRGFWTLPAGFMELGETLEQAASREAWEEACVKIRLDALYTLISLPQLSQVYAFFRARMEDESFAPGEESLEVRLFDEEEIPWAELAFETVRLSLSLFFQERREGNFQLHLEDIVLDRSNGYPDGKASQEG